MAFKSVAIVANFSLAVRIIEPGTISASLLLSTYSKYIYYFFIFFFEYYLVSVNPNRLFRSEDARLSGNISYCV